MCDELTEKEARNWMNQHPLDRRTFGAAGAASTLWAMLPGQASAATAATRSRTVSIATPYSNADAFFVTPDSGKHPAIIIWPDIAGLREAYEVMATRLAAAGYAVLAVNQYYRSAPAPILTSFAQWRTPEGAAKITPMREAITPAGTISDAAAFIDWLDEQSEVDTNRKIGTSGYCMGGPFTIRTAWARPGRVGAAASFHGSGMVTDTINSPHLQFAQIKAALLLAIAQNDDERAPKDKDILFETAQDANLPVEMEVYPAMHGWCTLDSPVYDKEQAEKAWGRMLATFSHFL